MISSKYNILIPINGENYVFNLASQCLLKVDKELAEYIQGEKNNISLSEQEQQQLADNGILVSSYELEFDRLKSNINSLKYDRSRYGVFISTTSGCNLNCTYCYQDIRKDICEKQYLTPENWAVMYNYFIKEIEKYNIKYFVVSLFGGEPMYNDKMCQTIAYDLRKLENKFPLLKVQMVLITNGTLFNEDNVEFYLKNIDTIQITIDGIKQIHDKYRIHTDGSGSFDEIIRGLQLLKDKSKQIDGAAEICLRVNVNNDTVENAKELVDYLVNIGISDYITSLSFHEIFDTQSDVLNNGGDPVEKNVELAMKICDLNFYIIKKGIRVFKELSGPCIGKMATGYAIDEHLHLYACPGIIYSEIQGKLNENGETEIFDRGWYDFYLNDSKCVEKCKYAPICYGGCTWAKGKKENDCMKEIYDKTIVPKLSAYILSKYV